LRHHRRARTQQWPLVLRNDTNVKFAPNAPDGLATLRGVRRFERGAHRLQLRDLRIAERALDQRGAVVAEDHDRRRQCDRDDSEQEQGQTPEQRTGVERHRLMSRKRKPRDRRRGRTRSRSPTRSECSAGLRDRFDHCCNLDTCTSIARSNTS
jgi:hypothetical protein